MASFGMPMSSGIGGPAGNAVQNVMMNIIRKLIETNPEYLSSGIPNDLITKLVGSQLMYNNPKPMYTVMIIIIIIYFK